MHRPQRGTEKYHRIARPATGKSVILVWFKVYNDSQVFVYFLLWNFFWRKNPFLLIYYSLPLIYLPRLFYLLPVEPGGSCWKRQKTKWAPIFRRPFCKMREKGEKKWKSRNIRTLFWGDRKRKALVFNLVLVYLQNVTILCAKIKDYEKSGWQKYDKAEKQENRMYCIRRAKGL